jgi:myo-inositol-1(or 4)-monophosphatase
MHGFLAELAKTGGRIAREHLSTVAEKDIRAKGARDWVSHVDRMVEDAITSRIRARYPQHRILGEEGGDSGGADGQPLWIIDPIDGTTNYLHGIPMFAISIAYCERGAPRHAAVYDPMRDELFTAEAGSGLWLNGQRCYTSGCTELGKAVLATSVPYRFPETLDACAKLWLEVQRACDDHRRGGSAALDMAWTAIGRLDGYYELGIYPWDTAAGELLVRAGGGVATDWRGDEGGLDRRRSMVCAATPALHAALLAKVKPLAYWLDSPPFDRL